MQEQTDIQLSSYVGYEHPLNTYLHMISDKTFQNFLKNNKVDISNILICIDDSINRYLNEKIEKSNIVNALYEWKDEFENSNTDMIIEIRDDFLEKTDAGNFFQKELDKQNELYLAEKKLESLKESNEKLIDYIDDYIFYRAAEKYNMFLLDEKIKESPHSFRLMGLSESYLISKNNIKENEIFFKLSEQEKSDAIFYFDVTEHYDRNYIENKKQLYIEKEKKPIHNRNRFNM